MLVFVDQPAAIGAQTIAIAQRLCNTVAHLPGLSMRRIADMYPDTANTNAKDVFIIADAAHSMPHTQLSFKISDEKEAALSMLTDFNPDLSCQIAQTSKRIRGLFTQIQPSLEHV